MFDEVYVVPLITFSVVFNRSILYKSICVSMGVREGKLGGGGEAESGKKFARPFRIMPEFSKKIFPRNFPKLLSTGGEE
jgi:hypothetical protein